MKNTFSFTAICTERHSRSRTAKRWPVELRSRGSFASPSAPCRSVLLVVALCVFLAAVVSCEKAEPAVWLTDYEAATAQATESGKSLVVFFSGNDWDGTSPRLMANIFSTPAFGKAAKNFVCVALDVISDDALLNEEIDTRALELAGRFGVQTCPTVLCATPAGNVFAELVYEPGVTTAQSFAASLADAEKTGKKTQDLLTQIGTATGAQKARLIDELLSITPDAYYEQYYDYALQIPELDPQNESGIVGPYKVQFVYNEALVHLFNGEYPEAVAVYDALAQDPTLHAEDVQQCYFYAAAFWHYAQNYAQVLEYLGKAYNAAPESENAAQIAETLQSLQDLYAQANAGNAE